jgi:hypothetical protein
MMMHGDNAGLLRLDAQWDSDAWSRLRMSMHATKMLWWYDAWWYYADNDDNDDNDDNEGLLHNHAWWQWSGMTMLAIDNDDKWWQYDNDDNDDNEIYHVATDDTINDE